MPVKTITFTKFVNSISLFCGEVIFWKRLNKHVTIISLNTLNINRPGGLHLSLEKLQTPNCLKFKNKQIPVLEIVNKNRGYQQKFLVLLEYPLNMG